MSLDDQAAERGALAGRRLLITGGSSGIGLATATLAVRRGARVAILARGQARLQEAAKALSAQAVGADVSNYPAVEAAVEQAAEALGGLDGVVNAAGLPPTQSFRELDPVRWLEVLQVNLTGPYYVCRAALPHLDRATGASIVNVGSGTALLPARAGPDYSASKGGLLAFTRSIAAELAPHIRVNAVCPGRTDTPLAQAVTAGSEEQANLGRYALGRAAAPAEIAEAILFLLSDAASFITGATLAADGGRTFH